MRTNGISQFNALPLKEQEIELLKERVRQTYNKRHLEQLPASKTEIGDYLEKRVRSEFILEDAIKKVTRKIKWPKLV